MALRSDHKALLFLGAVAILGAGVRAVRAAGGNEVGEQPALERQAQAADSAARAGRAKSRAKSRASGAKKREEKGESVESSRASRAAHGPLDHPGYVAGKLDLDVATAAQIDSLPGVGPAMARRIARDRIARGPFVTRDGLRRVPGTGPRFMAHIDSLVTFSGTVKHPSPLDTIIPKRLKSR